MHYEHLPSFLLTRPHRLFHHQPDHLMLNLEQAAVLVDLYEVMLLVRYLLTSPWWGLSMHTVQTL